MPIDMTDIARELRRPAPGEVFFHGCLGATGHYIHTKRAELDYHQIPWGCALDSGLLTDDYYRADTSPTGRMVYATKNGWSALAFWDRSGDRRPGSNSVFFCRGEVPAADLLALARDQWPEVFRRPHFPTLQLPA